MHTGMDERKTKTVLYSVSHAVGEKQVAELRPAPFHRLGIQWGKLVSVAGTRRRELSARFLKARSLVQIVGREKGILNLDKLLCASLAKRD